MKCPYLKSVCPQCWAKASGECVLSKVHRRFEVEWKELAALGDSRR